MKVKLAAIHFDSHEVTWHQSLLQSEFGYNLLNDWNTYNILLKEHFEDVLDDPIAELKQLQETDGTVDYHQKFEWIKTRVSLSDEYFVSAYLAGLRMNTHMHIIMFRPQTIRQCLLLERLYEKAHPKKPFVQGWSNSKPNMGGNQFKGVLLYKKDLDYKMGIVESKDKPKEVGNQPKQF